MISRSAFLKVFVNSFFIQSSWSYEKMQGLGFAAAISPAIEDIYKADGGKKAEAMKRHLAFYNAHPYMASPVLGAVARLEESTAAGDISANGSTDFKKKVMGAYGAVGDVFFWGMVRPLASIVGALCAVFWGLWGLAAFLALYNLFHLWMRWTGLKKGLSLGVDVVGYIKSLRLAEWAARGRLAALALLGVFATAAAWKASFFAPFWSAAYGLAVFTAVFAAAGFILGQLVKRGVSPAWLVYIVVAPVILLAALIF